MGSIAFKFGKITKYKPNRAGMKAMQSSPEMQGVLVAHAEQIADYLTAAYDGHYEAGPYNEGVYSTHHATPIGAHAFVRAEEPIAQAENRTYDVLNRALGG